MELPFPQTPHVPVLPAGLPAREALTFPLFHLLDS